MPVWKGRNGFIIANAAVDENPMGRSDQQEPLNRQDQAAGGFSDRAGYMALHNLGNIGPRSREKRIGRHEGTMQVEQSPDFDLTDFTKHRMFPFELILSVCATVCAAETGQRLLLLFGGR